MLIPRTATASAGDVRGRCRAPAFGDLIFATCGIELEIVDGATEQPRDLGDIESILRARPDLDQALVVRLLSTIAERGFARGQDLVENLVEKWAQIRSRFADRP